MNMDREQLVHDLSSALVARDHWHMEMESARAKMEEAQRTAYELELKLFESAVTEPSKPWPIFNQSISARVLDAFDKPKRIPEVAAMLGLSRQQVQVAVTRLVRRGKLVRRSRGVYVAVTTKRGV